jgi:hypothetical protein
VVSGGRIAVGKVTASVGRGSVGVIDEKRIEE